MRLLLLWLIAVVWASEDDIYVADVKTLLGAARHSASVGQLAESLHGSAYILPENRNNAPLLNVDKHEHKPLIPFQLPEGVDWMAVLSALAVACGLLLIGFTLRVLCLSRHRRLQGGRSSIAIPIDYRIQKKQARQQQQ